MSSSTSTHDDVRPTVLVTRVRLRNFRSVVSCDVRLGPLAILVGPNGSGKSNFLDALCFTSQALREGLGQAVRERGFADDILSRSASPANSDEFGIDLSLQWSDGTTGAFAYTIGVPSLGGYELRHEACSIWRVGEGRASRYEVGREGEILCWSGVSLDAALAPARARDRLYLVNVSGLTEFRPVYDALAGMAFYNLSPARMCEPRAPDAGERLLLDGANVASVLRHMYEADATLATRIGDYLGGISSGLTRVDAVRVGKHETLQFSQAHSPARSTLPFRADQVSDGTLRALGILVALFQARMSAEPTVSLVAIEEPENALHPAAAGVLLDALRDASETTQVIVTTHSADLLDRVDPDDVTLLAVSADGGATQIGSVGHAARTAIREGLYTPGELLRMGQLSPERGAANGTAYATPTLASE